MKLPNTLSFRLSLYYSLVFMVFLIIALGFSYLLLKKSLDDEAIEDLTEDLHEYSNVYQYGGIEKIIHEMDIDIKGKESDDEFIQLFNTGGQLIHSTNMENWKGLDLKKYVLKNEFNFSSRSRVIIDILELPEQEHDTRIAYSMIDENIIMFIGESLEETNDLLELLLIIFSIIFFSAIPLTIIVVWFIARQSVRDISKVSRAASAIRNGDLEYRVDINNQCDEIQYLANTFNAMAERIKALVSEMREMIDNIAHDLRSPLGRIRMISEMTLSGNGNEECKVSAANTLEQCDKLLEYINATLDVAEAEAAVGYNHNEKINITSLAKEACEIYEPIADDKNIKISAKLEPDCFISGNKQYIQRMIANIIDNAIKYTPINGKVTIKLGKNGNYINLSVMDTGIGIPETEQIRVFDRFFRCDQSRSEEGCGLGLSFSRAVARSHGGDITLTSTPGLSSTFTISLPLTFKPAI